MQETPEQTAALAEVEDEVERARSDLQRIAAANVQRVRA